MLTSPRVVWSLCDWCDAIVALPAHPQRCVLVPNSRVVHAVRRALVDEARTHLLVGTHFVTLRHVVTELLAGAGEPITLEDPLRLARLRAVLATPPKLEYFDANAMRTTPGWAEALCTTLNDLESAGLTPDTTPTSDRRWRDVAAIWRRANSLATGPTLPQATARAAERLVADPSAWPLRGPTLAAVTVHTSAVEAELIAAIPRVELAVLAARPMRADTLDRLASLFGDRTAAAVTEAEPPRPGTSEREILAAYLLETPARLLDAKRPRSTGRDGTVELEDHAGVEEELEAAVTWTCRCIRAGTPLQQIALLVPELDPLASLLTQRLGRLPQPPAVFVAGGLPVTDLPTGARLLDVVRALRAWLSAGAVARLVPHLDATRSLALSPSAAVQAIWLVGTGGGSHAQREEALRWPERLAVRIADLDVEIARACVGEDDVAQSGHARETRAARDLAARLRAMQPPLQALATIAGQVLAGAPLATLVPALLSWVESHLFVPEEHQPLVDVIAEALEDLVRADPEHTVTGDPALRAIADAIERTRYRVGRFGEPAIYIGSVRGALGLAFSHTRVLGLAEGTIPGGAREDPLLPETLRASAGLPLTSATQRSLEDVHALDWVVRNSGAICLSAPRSDTDRTSKEPSSLFVEIAAALGRDHRRLVPDTTSLVRDYFAPARADLEAERERWPHSESAWQWRLARLGDLIPPGWVDAPSLDLTRSRALHDSEDGILDGTALTSELPGISSRRGISPTRLGSLLACPHRFLLESLLGWSEPAAPPLQREIVQPYYGSLLHLAHETFFEKFGVAFGERQRSLEHWRARGARVASDAFDRFLHEYPLTGDAVRDQQRRRLLADFDRLLVYDWDQGVPRTFHSTELAFGFDEPLSLEVGAVSLGVRGRIDRIDVRDGVTQIRDLKSGKPHPRTGGEREPHPGVDLQIALYAMVARARASEWKLPKRLSAAYVYPRTEVYTERAFTTDIEELLEAAARWMTTAHGLLSARAFVQTPDRRTCELCPFAPVCGDEAPSRAKQRLRTAGSPELAAYAVLNEVAP